MSADRVYELTYNQEDITAWYVILFIAAKSESELKMRKGGNKSKNVRITYEYLVIYIRNT